MAEFSFDLLAAQQALSTASLNNVTKFARRLSGFDLSVASRAVGGLLLLPKMQASNYRVEMLAHAVVCSCNGHKALRQRDLAKWLTEAGKIVGHHEDPAEDVFAGRVSYEGRNYRILDGLSEGGCYHLQLILQIVEKMPSKFRELKDVCRNCLILSEAMCQRAGINVFEVGEEYPLRQRITPEALPSLRTLCGWVTFSAPSLEAMGISGSALESFVLPPEKRNVLAQYADDSPLSRKPLLRFGGDIVVALPTAIGPAIRSAVIDHCISLGPLGKQIFRMQHLSLVANQLLETPMIHQIGMNPSPLSLEPIVPSPPIEVDPGYWVQIILAADDLAGFEQDGLLGSSRSGAQTQIQLNAAIRAAREQCEVSSNFKAGLTFVVMCGIGRGQMMGLITQVNLGCIVAVLTGRT